MNAIALALAATTAVVATTIHAADEVAVEAPAAPEVAETGVTKEAPAAKAANSPDSAELKAIDAAIEWLIARQQPDGSWKDDGVENRYAATALVLMALLDRGHSHKQGPFRQQCERGLACLAGSVVKGAVVDARDDARAQSLVGMALAKAYGMTDDQRLTIPTQLFLNAIAAAPDRSTSAVGWKLLALHSGQRARVEIDLALVVSNAVAFLDSVAADEGATLVSTAPGDDPRASVVSLWARAVTEEETPALRRGVERIVRIGPTGDPLFNLFTTQVARHIGGEIWQEWRGALAHDAGDWLRGTDGEATFDGPVTRTALAALLLEATLLDAGR